MSVWSNTTPIAQSFTDNPQHINSNIGSIPAWAKNTGTVNGKSPTVTPTPYNRPKPNAAKFMANFPNIFKISH